MSRRASVPYLAVQTNRRRRVRRSRVVGDHANTGTTETPPLPARGECSSPAADPRRAAPRAARRRAAARAAEPRRRESPPLVAPVTGKGARGEARAERRADQRGASRVENGPTAPGRKHVRPRRRSARRWSASPGGPGGGAPCAAARASERCEDASRLRFRREQCGPASPARARPRSSRRLAPHRGRIAAQVGDADAAAGAATRRNAPGRRSSAARRGGRRRQNGGGVGGGGDPPAAPGGAEKRLERACAPRRLKAAAAASGGARRRALASWCAQRRD